MSGAAFWDARARLGASAGTNDLIAKNLEQRAILAEIKSELADRPSHDFEILEIGCGLGETASRVCRLAGVSSVVAIDESPAMIDEAINGEYGIGADFRVGDAMCPPDGPFDIIYTQRCLINLPTWEAQRQAIDAIAGRLVDGGLFLMLENSADALRAINATRRAFGVEPMKRSSHHPVNLYFEDALLATISSLRLRKCVPCTGAYYLLSRVLNPALHEVPSYEAKINKLALMAVPGWFNDALAPLSQSRVWVWEKQ